MLTPASPFDLTSRKPRERRLQRSNLFMITSTLLMYCLGTAQIALTLHVNLIAYFDQHAIEGGDTILDDAGNRFAWIGSMIQLLNVSLGCVWRES